MRKLRTALLAVALVVGYTCFTSAQDLGKALRGTIYRQLAQVTKKEFKRRGYVCAPVSSLMPSIQQYIWYLATCTRTVR